MVTLFSSSNTPHQPHNKQEDAPRSDFADNPTATRALDDARAVTHSFPSKSIDSPGNLFTTHHVGQSQVHGERCKEVAVKKASTLGEGAKASLASVKTSAVEHAVMIKESAQEMMRAREVPVILERLQAGHAVYSQSFASDFGSS